MSKKLYRSKKNKIIGGVCGGIAEYFNVDPTIVRLLWLFLTLGTGVFFIAYLLAMLIMPYRLADGESEEEVSTEKNKSLAILIGVGFILYGIIKFAERIFDDFEFRFSFFRIIPPAFFWPAALILAGVVIIFALGRKDK
jgi:phage shock protein C